MQYKRLILFFLLWIFPAAVDAAGAVVEIGTEIRIHIVAVHIGCAVMTGKTQAELPH